MANRRPIYVIFLVVLPVLRHTSVAWTCGPPNSRPTSRLISDETVFQYQESTPEKTRRATTSLRWVDDQIVSDPSQPNDEDNEIYPAVLTPNPDLSPEEIPSLLMKALKRNNFPEVDSGLRTMWDFAGGNTKHIFKHNITEYIESAHETADTLPTSFYGVAMYGLDWRMETEINRVGGEEGWIATQLMRTISSDGRMRRWQWELRKNKRPPYLGCWLVETIGSSDRKGKFEVE